MKMSSHREGSVHQRRDVNALSVGLLFLVGSTFGSGPVLARVPFVAQRHPEARDDNPGTETKPFKAIQLALDKAQPGDTVWVTAGEYEEAVEVRGPGRVDAPIILSAWQDDQVRLGSILRDLPPAKEWRPLKGSKSWAVTLPAAPPEDAIVILDGKPIVTQLKDTPPEGSRLDWATYRAADRTLIAVGARASP